MISPTEVAVCGSLCALGSLRRSALKSELLLNDAFRTYVDEESYVRDLVDAFVDGKYKECLELLEKHSVSHLEFLFLQRSLSLYLTLKLTWSVCYGSSLDPTSPHAVHFYSRCILDGSHPSTSLDSVFPTVPVGQAVEDGSRLWMLG